MHRHLSIIMVAALFLSLLGCAAGPTSPRIFWPPLPQEPKLEFIGVYYSKNQLDTSRSARAMTAMVGGGDALSLQLPYGIVSDGRGLVYVSDPGGLNVRIFDFNSKKVTDLFKQPFGAPYGLAVDSAGRLYVAVPKSRNVMVFSAEQQPLFQFGGDVLERPDQLAIDEARGRVYVSDPKKHTIEAFDLQGNHLMTIGGPGNGAGQLAGPSGVALDREGNIFVAEMLNARIHAFTPAGTPLRHFGRRGSQITGFDMPKDLGFDSDGNLHVIDLRKAALLSYTPEGELLLHTGASGPTSRALGFGSPNSMHIDAHDRIYVADLLNKRFSVWQYLSPSYLQQRPITDEDREAIRLASEGQKAGQSGKR